MNSYVTGNVIKNLREKKHLTQKELAEIIMVSEKTISKWETNRGLPDISLIEDLARALDVSIIELFNGEVITNTNKCANMLKTKFYVCPICGNVITSIGEGVYSCCGNNLILLEPEETNDIHIEKTDELYVTIDSEMTKKNYISFIAYVTSDKITMTKLYPEQTCETYFKLAGHGFIYYYDIKNGLYKQKI